MTARRLRSAEQLPLLPPTAPAVPVRFRLDAHTRQVGLAGIAEARRILAEQARRRAEHGQQLTQRAA
jgi:hypothetical protein